MKRYLRPQNGWRVRVRERRKWRGGAFWEDYGIGWGWEVVFRSIEEAYIHILDAYFNIQALHIENIYRFLGGICSRLT